MLCHVVGSLLPDVLKKHTPSPGTHNTEDKGQTFLQNAMKKLPDHSVYQPKKPGSLLQNMSATITSLQHSVMFSR
jgi:hypothetical protein